MSEQIHVRGILPKKEASPLKKNIWRVIKLTFFLSFFLFVIATVLTKIGGSSPTLRTALEDLLTENRRLECLVKLANVEVARGQEEEQQQQDDDTRMKRART